MGETQEGTGRVFAVCHRDFMCTSFSYTLGKDFDGGLLGGVEIGGERPSIQRIVLG